MAEKGCDEGFGIEILKVFNPFSDTDQANGEFKLFGDCDDDAAARRAVQFRQDQARHPHGFMELASLSQRILPDRGIQDQQHFMGRPRHFLADHTLHFAEFIHEVGLGMQAAGRIDKRHVRRTRFCRRNAVERFFNDTAPAEIYTLRCTLSLHDSFPF